MGNLFRSPTEVEGLKRDKNGEYLEPIGKNKNLNNTFSIIIEGNEPIWSTLEIITHKDKIIYLVNNKIVMILSDSRHKDKNGEIIPLTKGKIQLQRGAAEIFYKDIKIKSIDNIPPQYTKYL